MRPPITEWADDNVFVRMAVVTIALLTALAVLPAIASSIPSAMAQTPDPIITVDAHTDGLWGDHWPASLPITVTTGTNTWNATSDGNGNFWLDVGSFDVQAGQTFSATDGTTTKNHTVLPLAVTGVNDTDNTVSGTADVGTDVWVDVHGIPDVGRTVVADGSGNWTTDFDVSGDGGATFDLVPGTNGYTGQYDGDNDATNADWHVPDPHFSVETPNQIWSTGEGWIEGTTVTLTIDDPSNGVGTDYSDTTTVVSWGPSPWEVGFNFDTDPFVIEPSHVVAVTDGTNTRTLAIVDITVDTIDDVNDVLTGSAPPDAFVEVNAGDDMSNAHRSVQADVSGVWTADFSVPGSQDHETETMDLAPGVGGAAETYDDDGDGNHRGWRVASPRFKAGVDNNDLSGWEWLPDSTVDITIDGGTPYSFPTDEWGNFGGDVAFDLEVGQLLVAEDGNSIKDFVIRNLYVTDVDVDNDMVHGTSAPGDVVQVEAHGDNGQWREVTADGSGDWTADFSVVWEESGTFDIVAGSNGNARYYEPDGDETQRSWHVSDPRITASVIHEEVWTYDFPNEPEGQTLYYRLDDPDTLEIDFQGDMPLLAQGDSTESGDHSFGRYDVQAGHTFTVRNRPFDEPLGDGMERVLAISNVTVESVDGDSDVITGTADPAEGPRLCVWSQESELCSEHEAFTWNEDNSWSADFSSLGGIAPGHWNSVSQYEADGDETHFWWNLPPWIVVEVAEEDDGGTPVWPDAVRVEQWTGPIVYLEIDGAPIAQWTHEGNGDYTFELPDFDIEPGHIVRVHDLSDDKSVLVEPLTIDQVNYSADVPPNTVFGSTSAHRDVRVQASASIGGWWAERGVNSDSSGSFSVDFGVPGSGWREQWIAELGGAEGLGRNMFLEIYDPDNDRVETRQCGGIARIEIARSDGRIDAYDFAEGSTVTIEIDDPSTSETVDYTDSATAVRSPDNPCETIATFHVGVYVIPDEAAVSASGVSASGDEVTATTVVIPFTINIVDPNTDTISGTAGIGLDVYVEADGNWRYAVAIDDPVDELDVGYWVVDFSTPGSEPGEEYVVDLGPGSSGRAIMLDDVGNTTELSWRISAAQFAVNPADDNVDGWEFTPNSSVTIVVNDVAVPGSPFGTDDGGNFSTGWDSTELDITAGDVVVVSDGDATKGHTVTDLVVTGVDEATDAVSGTAAAGSTVDVWIHNTDVNVSVTADGSGVWNADFSGIADLVAGSNGNSGQCDDDNDCTNAGWGIPNAQFQVDSSDNHIWTQEFAGNSAVAITVNDVDVPGSPFDTDDGGNIDVRWDASELDIVSGDLVEITDGDSTKNHTVTDLAITGVGETSDVVSGVAEPGSTVDVWEHDTGANLQVIACDGDVLPCDGDDPVGTWHADFSGLADLVAGSNGNSGQCDDDNDCTNAGWRIAAAQFTASPEYTSVWGNDWLPNSPVTITVNGTEVPGSPLGTDGEGAFGVGWDPEELPLGADDVVVVTDGDSTKLHTVTHLEITGVDELSDIVSGFAAPGSTVDVWIDGLEHNLEVTACDDTAAFPCDGDDLGTWHADFSSMHDLVPGDTGGSNQRDVDNDSTFASWQIVNPTFTVSADGGGVEGWGWVSDVQVTIVFDDDDDSSNGVLFETDTMSDGEGNLSLDLWDQFDIQPGMHVEVTDGEAVKTHWVTGLAVTDVNPDSDVVSGFADPGSEVEVTIWTDDFGVVRVVTACDDSAQYPCEDGDPGLWHADFSVDGNNPDRGDEENQPWDIEVGTSGGAFEYDDDGDATRADWWVRNPIFVVYPDGDGVHGDDWMPDTLITITFDDDDDASNGVLFEIETTSMGESNFDIGTEGEFDIEPGQHVVVTDGDTTKTHWVTGVAVIDVDLDADAIAGIADPGAEVEVSIWTDDFTVARSVVACDGSEFYPCMGDDALGTWHADFSVAVTDPDNNDEENQAWDIDFGSQGGVNEYDEDGDSTQIDWWVQNPTFVVSAEGDWVNGDQWARDSMVTLTFDADDDLSNGVLFETDTMSDGDGNLYIELWEEFDIQPGQYVVVTDGAATKTHWVTGVTVTGADADTDTVIGTAEPGAEVVVDVHAQLEGLVWEHVVFQFGPGRFDKNPDSLNEYLLFRQAIAHAIDRDLLAATLPSAGEAIDSYLDAYAPVAAGDAWAQYPYDPAMAIALIDQLCADLGRDCVVDPPAAVLSMTTGASREELADELTLMLAAVGIDVVLDQNDTYPPGMFEGFFDLGEWAWVATPTYGSLVEMHGAWDPEQRFQDNMYHWGTPDSSVINGATERMAELVGLMNETDDHALLESYFTEGEQILADEVVFIPLYVREEKFDVEESPQVTVIAEPDGTWTADFSGLFDLEPGTEGSASEPDDDGDRTQADWRVRGLPEFGVSATHDIIEGYDFTGDTVTFSLDDNEDPGDGVLFEESTELDPDGNFFRPLEGEFDVEVDQFVTVSDGVTTKTTYVAAVDVTAVDLVNDTITGVADPEAEVFIDGFGDLHHTVTADEFGDWFLDLAGEIDLEVPVLVVPDQRDEDNDRTFALWETLATVEGHVRLDGAPLAGAEVWLAPDNFTCTDVDGYFVFDEASMLDAAIHGANAATGPAVNAEAGCANAEFLDPEGVPLLVAFHGDFDLWDGYEYIEFNVERAAALQTVLVEEFDGVGWEPLDDVMVHAFDLNDPDFVAAYGNDPDPADYRTIFDGDLGRIETTWTGANLFSLPGTSELRYPAVTDVLVLAEAPNGMILGDRTGAAEFVDPGDGVHVGPAVVFQIGPPIITAIIGPDEPIAVDTEVTISATFVDPTVGDSHAATVEWGDGTTTDADVEFDAGDGTASGVHTYAEAGVYTVIVTVTDSGGLFDTEEFSYVVVYDPDGGFVTGGGWIYSPAGAYAADPALEGTANFGFVSKYKKGAKAPTGNTEFQFQAGDLNFHSDVYDWLVIAGARAQFKGTGTINGSGEFGFMLTAVDEALTPSADVDLFRIKIWDKVTDEIVYDNQIGEVDGAAVTTEISGGSIVIHKAKK